GDAPAGRCTEIRPRLTGATRSAGPAPGDAGTVSGDRADLPLAGRGSLSRHPHQHHGAVPADIPGGADWPGWSRSQVRRDRQAAGKRRDRSGLRGSTSRRAVALRPALGGMTPPRVDSQELVVLLTRPFWA